MQTITIENLLESRRKAKLDALTVHRHEFDDLLHRLERFPLKTFGVNAAEVAVMAEDYGLKVVTPYTANDVCFMYGISIPDVK